MCRCLWSNSLLGISPRVVSSIHILSEKFTQVGCPREYRMVKDWKTILSEGQSWKLGFFRQERRRMKMGWLALNILWLQCGREKIILRW
jgi:hypothetical protein